MTAAIDWSYALLEQPEQRLLRHLGVFPSSFGLDALEALRPLLDGVDLTAVLASLVDKSLVVRELDTSSYQLLESIRAFAVERLVECGERDVAFEHHRRWTVGVARATSKLDRWMSGRLAARRHADAEHVRQAFWSSLDAGQFERRRAGRHPLVRVAQRGGLRRGAPVDRRLRRPRSRAADRGLGRAAARRHRPRRRGLPDHDRLRPGVRPARGGPRRRRLRIGAAVPDAAAPARPGPRRRALAEVLEISPDERLSNLLRAFAVVAHAGRTTLADLEVQVTDLERRCSADGYDRFILNWAMWLHGPALRDAYWARRGSTSNTTTSSDGSPRDLAHGLSRGRYRDDRRSVGARALSDALGIASREGTASRATAARSCLLRGVRRRARNRCRVPRSGPHLPLQRHRAPRLHGLVVDPIVRHELDPADYSDSVARGRTRSVEVTLHQYGIRAR